MKDSYKCYEKVLIVIVTAIVLCFSVHVRASGVGNKESAQEIVNEYFSLIGNDWDKFAELYTNEQINSFKNFLENEKNIREYVGVLNVRKAKLIESIEIKYDDVKLDFTDNDIIPQWAVPAVKAVYKEGIILGRVNDDGTSTFAPYDNITRAEAMTILGRILPNNDDLPNLPFADKNDIPQWAEEGVSKLYSTGIVSGYEDNTILPNNNMKRGEAATILYKIENK
mgnify:CR=1 FL=1